MVLIPSDEQVGGMVVIVGTAGGPADAALLKELLAAEEQFPSFACTV